MGPHKIVLDAEDYVSSAIEQCGVQGQAKEDRFLESGGVGARCTEIMDVREMVL